MSGEKEKKSRPIRRAIAGGLVAGLMVMGFQYREAVSLEAGVVAAHIPETIVDFTQKTDSKQITDPYKNFDAGDLLLSSDHGWRYGSAWPYSRALDASYTATLLPNVGENYKKDYQRRLAATQRYWNTDPQGYPPGYDPGLKDLHFGEPLHRYIDDNLWLGIIMARDYSHSGNVESLKNAKRVFSLATSQWDEKGGGGIFWKEQLPGETELQKSIVSNGPAIVLGVDLYQATGDKSYLDWAEKGLEWTDKHLKDPVEGIYSDSITGEKVERAKFTYCQGVMVGALTTLSEVDPAKYPLQRAVDFARTAMDYFDVRGYGNPSFDLILFQHSLYLAGKYDNPDFTERVRKSLRSVTAPLPDNHDELSTYSSILQLKIMEKLGPEEYKRLL